MAVSSPGACPDSLRAIKPYLIIASEHDGKDDTVSYWCRLFAIQKGLAIPNSTSVEKLFLAKLMDVLEEKKKTKIETFVNETAAQAYIENYALKLFQWADNKDRAGDANKNVVKAFYTSGQLMEILQIFGELSDDFIQNKKYAQWKATYLHNCLKNGEIPIPGPPTSGEGSEGPSTSITSPPYPTPISSSNDHLPSPPRSNSNEDVIPPVYPAQSGFFPPPSQPSYPRELPVQIPPNPSFSLPSPSPASGMTPSIPLLPETDEVKTLEVELIQKCKKYIKFAGSALDYDDYKEAKLNLIKALNILNTGQDQRV